MTQADEKPSDTRDEQALFKAWRLRLCDSDGRTYREVRAVLSPRYGLLWLQLLTGHVVLAVSAAATAYAVSSTSGIAADVAVAVGGAVVVGYTLAYIALWFHEAAHLNIHPSPAWNDRLANLLIGVLLGLDIKAYRCVHLQHHRLHGTTGDSERSYFSPLDIGFLLRSLCGVGVLQVMAVRRQVGGDEEIRRRALAMRLAGIALHAGVLVLFTTSAGAPTAAIAWGAGVLMVFPFFASLRQLLEHRHTDAASDTDFTAVDHGPLTRVFGAGPLASTFGGAGFNRHLIHHWDMTLSCTRFAEMEAFLKDTALGNAYRERETTYLGAFKDLFVTGSRITHRAALQ